MTNVLLITKAMSDASRLRILMFLREQELCVCQIMEMLGLAPATVSAHLNVLHRAGLLESRRAGRWIYYRLPGRGTPSCVRTAISWLQKSLADDPQTAKDTKKLKTVGRMKLDELCCRYKQQSK